ncbi:hypothetical protein PIB30_081991 [Stylosanthes scabra]|uniref:Uncharacterized protein n=1 Tax=Stylosanthes scabra TaxID=79078 RepID=A0ABU6RSQ3_9FABA|nr:hypothetical protein [Stylosanthes scabra]
MATAREGRRTTTIEPERREREIKKREKGKAMGDATEKREEGASAAVVHCRATSPLPCRRSTPPPKLRMSPSSSLSSSSSYLVTSPPSSDTIVVQAFSAVVELSATPHHHRRGRYLRHLAAIKPLHHRWLCSTFTVLKNRCPHPVLLSPLSPSPSHRWRRSRCQKRFVAGAFRELLKLPGSRPVLVLSSLVYACYYILSCFLAFAMLLLRCYRWRRSAGSVSIVGLRVAVLDYYR